MVKSDIFWEIANKVADVCQINVDDIMLDFKDQKSVDARVLTVQCAMRLGFTPGDIAKIVLSNREASTDPEALQKKARMVSNVNRAYITKWKQSALFRMLSLEIREWVKDTFDITIDM